MNSSSWSSSYRQKLRVRFYNWLTQGSNTTDDKPQAHTLAGHARSFDTHHIANGQYRPLLDVLPTINDTYMQLSNRNTDGTGNNIQHSTNTSDYESYPNNSSSGIFNPSWWLNQTNSLQAAASDMMHSTSAYETFQSHAPNAPSHFFDLNNFTKTFNLTEDHIKDFVTKSVQLNKLINESGVDDDVGDSSACHYCNGFIKDIFGGYKNMHGYISLAVRVFSIFSIEPIALLVAEFVYSMSICAIIPFPHPHIDLHIWNNSQHSQHNRIDPQRYEQNTD